MWHKYCTNSINKTHSLHELIEFEINIYIVNNASLDEGPQNRSQSRNNDNKQKFNINTSERTKSKSLLNKFFKWPLAI